MNADQEQESDITPKEGHTEGLSEDSRQDSPQDPSQDPSQDLSRDPHYAAFHEALHPLFEEMLPRLMEEVAASLRAPVEAWMGDLLSEIRVAGSAAPDRYSFSVGLMRERLQALRAILAGGDSGGDSGNDGRSGADSGSDSGEGGRSGGDSGLDSGEGGHLGVVNGLNLGAVCDGVVDRLLAEVQTLPGILQVPQAEERFVDEAADPLGLIARKAVKRVVRAVQKDRAWMQSVHVQEFVTDQLLRDPAWVEMLVAEALLPVADAVEFILTGEWPVREGTGEKLGANVGLGVRPGVSGLGAGDLGAGGAVASAGVSKGTNMGAGNSTGAGASRDAGSRPKSGDRANYGSHQPDPKLSATSDVKTMEPVLHDFRIGLFKEIVPRLEAARDYLQRTSEVEDAYGTQGTPRTLRMLQDLAVRAHAAIELADTVEEVKPEIRPEVSPAEFTTIRESLRKRFARFESAWERYFETQLADLTIEREIAAQGDEAAGLQQVILEKTRLFFRDFGYRPMEMGLSAVREKAELLRENGSGQLTQAIIDKTRNDLESLASDSMIEPFADVDTQEQVLGEIREEIGRLQLKMGRFTEVLTMAEERTVELPDARVKTTSLEWRALAARFLQERVLRQITPENQDLLTFVARLWEESEEGIRIADVNLMAALDARSIKGEEQTPREIATQGLERAVHHFETSIQTIRKKQDEYEKMVKVQLPGVLADLETLIRNRQYDRLEFQDKTLQMKAQALTFRDRVVKFSAIAADRITLAARFVGKRSSEISSRIRYLLGFTKKEALSTREKRDLTEYLAGVRIDPSLPFIYKRLFDYQYEIDRRFYVPPRRLFDLVAESYRDWNRHLETNLLIFGEKGSGKSTAIRFISDELFRDHTTVYLRFDQTFYRSEQLISRIAAALQIRDAGSGGSSGNGITTAEELIERIQRRKRRTVLVIEDLHNAFIRSMHGFEALRAFWTLMSSTKENLFWVVSTSRYSWNFFEKMSGASQYFSHIHDVGQLNSDQIREAILERHRSTGYRLEFVPGDAERNTRTFKKLLGDKEQSQTYLQESYFEKLSDVSEGNLSIAILIWLQSIRDFDRETFRIAPLEIIDMDKIEVPERNVMFLLAALVLHDRLNEEELAMALHQGVTECRLMATRLKSKGLLVEGKNGFQMNQLVYRQVIRLLKRRNVLH
jgi:hypothetical protein